MIDIYTMKSALLVNEIVSGKKLKVEQLKHLLIIYVCKIQFVRLSHPTVAFGLKAQVTVRFSGLSKDVCALEPNKCRMLFVHDAFWA